MKLCNIFKTAPANILCTMQDSSDFGHNSACVSFEGFAGHVDHIPMDEVDVKADIVPIRWARQKDIHDPIDTRFSWMTIASYKSTFMNDGILYNVYKTIENDCCSHYVKLMLCYLSHKQTAYQMCGDTSYEKKFKQELDALPLFSAKIKLLIGLTSLCTLGAPFISYYRCATKNRKELLDTLQAKKFTI